MLWSRKFGDSPDITCSIDLNCRYKSVTTETNTTMDTSNTFDKYIHKI